MVWETNKSSGKVHMETTEERKSRRLCEFWVFISDRGGKGLPCPCNWWMTGPGEGAGVGGEAMEMYNV